jgi:FkbM family methyltransferase
MFTRLSRLFKRPQVEKTQHPASVFKKSFSQYGEDLIVDGIFQMRGIFKPTFIDIGANDPFKLNNTAIFYQRHSRGINLDANPHLIQAFQRWRPEDKNLNYGIGKGSGELDFYIMEDNTFSTFSADEKDRMLGCGHKLAAVTRVEVRSLNWILQQHSSGIFPDFLSLDVEGMDMEILESMDWSASVPKVVCVEAAEYSPNGTGRRRSDLIEFVESKGYFEYANTNLNAVFVRKDFWFV